MLIHRDQVIQRLRDRGDHDRASAAVSALPRIVDAQRDAGVLHQFEVSVDDVEGAATEGCGGVTGEASGESGAGS